MEVSIAQYINDLFPWDLEIPIGGKVYKTRPLVLGDLALLDAIKTGQVKDLTKVGEFVGSLFMEPRPNVMAWTTDELLAVLLVVSQYQNEHAKKNAQRMGDAVAQRKASPSTPGNSSVR